jgi:hypothetical protein
MEVKMKRLIAGVTSMLLAGAALAADAQGSARERAIKRCQENRGVDCKTEQGLKPWIDEEIEVQHRHVIGAQQRTNVPPPAARPMTAPGTARGADAR